MFRPIDTRTTRCIDVTGLTLSERHALFAEFMSQDGFRGFTQHTTKGLTQYTFHYQKEQKDCLKGDLSFDNKSTSKLA